MPKDHKRKEHHLLIADYLAWAEQGLNAHMLLPHILFRGQANCSWPTLPSLLRIHSSLKSDQIQLLEKQVIEEFRKKEQLDKATWDDLEVLAFARHHGAPTRLLDWSQNALVALWFCVNNKQLDHLDGKIICLNVFINNDKMAPAMGDLWLETVEGFGTGQHMLSFTVKPTTSRIQRQDSVFTIAAYKKGAALKSVEEYFGISTKAMEKGVREMVVPAAIKPQLRKTLSKVGLDASNIYGGPDALGKTITDRLEAFFER